MELHRYDLGVPLDGLVRELRRAIDGWDWSRGGYGHALSLPHRHQLHPYNRYGYENSPCTGLLDGCPLFARIFDSLETEKVSFRLLRRGPNSSYAWHTDAWKGPGVVRFQVPIVSDESAFMVITDYARPDQVRRSANGRLGSFEEFARANAGHFRRHHLEPGLLHYFDATRVHTLVNPGPGERVTLSFDLVANDWLLERFPEVRVEVGDRPVQPPPRPGPLRNGVAFALSRLYPLRNRFRALRGAPEG